MEQNIHCIFWSNIFSANTAQPQNASFTYINVINEVFCGRDSKLRTGAEDQSIVYGERTHVLRAF